MRSIRSIPTLALMLLSGIGPGFAAEKCVERRSANKVHMKSEPDHVGYCATFATRALLHEFRCERDPANCALPAMLDLIRMAHDRYGEVEGNGIPYMLDALEQESLTIADESCLPYEDFWTKHSRSAKAAASFQRIFFDNAFAKTESHLEPVEGCVLKLVVQFNSLPPGFDLKAIMRKHWEALRAELKAHVSKRNCARRKFPPFELWYLSHHDDPESMKTLLKAGYKLVVPLFVPEPDGKQRGYHAVTVTNFSEKCCAGTCVTSYEVLDSLGHYWAPSAFDGWVSDADFEPNIARGSAFYFLRSPTDPPLPRMNNPRSKLFRSILNQIGDYLDHGEGN